ncbi:MAG: hypothetical protein HKN14_12760 [Marinicaulis sp.]|nr:cation:proton antiporter [Marinicaulis sp.]NNE41775.1 hypothetical protein [Marinicaulis sp.]NNL89403.1 hypothetical protein [Marinicaulis sp.]
MTLAITAVILAAFFWILTKAKALSAPSRTPAILIALGAVAAIIYRATGNPYLPSEWVAAGADVLLAALAFGAASQFKISELAKVCPASFRLTIGGAPAFLVICGLGAFILVPQLPLGAAFLVAGALMLNGAAFDRRAVASAPAPSVIKAAVRLESAAILAIGVPVAVLLEAAATAAPTALPAITPIFEAARSLFLAFAVGGGLGLTAAFLDKRLKSSRYRAAPVALSAIVAAGLAGFFGFHPVVAAAAAGLLWGEDTTVPITTRVRLRRRIERPVAPIAYFAFGALLGPRLFQADLLLVIFAIAAVTIMRALPRLHALRKSTLPKESQMFLAWFGGAPGAASALFLISLFDAPSIVAQDAVLTVGAVAVIFGVVAARATSKPLLNAFLKQIVVARKRRLFAG